MAYRERDRLTDQLIATIRNHTDSAPISFESSQELYVVTQYAPDLRGRCFFLDFERGEIGDVDSSRISVRDLARKFAEFYGQPGLMTWDRLRTLPKRYLVLHHPPGKTTADRQTAYPGFCIRGIDNDLAELQLIECRASR